MEEALHTTLPRVENLQLCVIIMSSSSSWIFLGRAVAAIGCIGPKNIPQNSGLQTGACQQASSESRCRTPVKFSSFSPPKPASQHHHSSFLAAALIHAFDTFCAIKPASKRPTTMDSGMDSRICGGRCSIFQANKQAPPPPPGKKKTSPLKNENPKKNAVRELRPKGS